MSLSTESTEGEPVAPASAPAPASVPGSLLAGGSGDRCAVCNAKLAIDQRYCVECGTRRGSPRFTLARSEPHSAGAVASGRPGGNAAVTRVQLLLALLLVAVAIGVGVLIGHGTAGTAQVKLTGGGVAAPTSGGSGARSGSGAKTSSGSGGGNLFNSGS